MADDGTKYWGRFGAAGLLAVDPERGVLLQQRVGWSHFGGTWGIPGGALHEGEDVIVGAIRESQEEAGVPDGAVRVLFTSVYDVGIWRYTTAIAVVERAFEPVIADPESVALAWVAVDDVTNHELHPGFAASWTGLREAMATRPVIVVDVANVMGATPNGWWKDRAGAARGILERLELLALHGVDAEALGLVGATWFPRVIAVVEGAARDVVGGIELDRVELVSASGSGDDAIVAAVADAVGDDGTVVHVVTSDRELRARVEALGATTHGTRWLTDQLP